jgi:hypothetical protein
MHKQISLIVKDDVTALNKRLKEGYSVNNTIQLADGMLIVLAKYVADERSVAVQLSPEYGISPTRNY